MAVDFADAESCYIINYFLTLDMVIYDIELRFNANQQHAVNISCLIASMMGFDTVLTWTNSGDSCRVQLTSRVILRNRQQLSRVSSTYNGRSGVWQLTNGRSLHYRRWITAEAFSKTYYAASTARHTTNNDDRAWTFVPKDRENADSHRLHHGAAIKQFATTLTPRLNFVLYNCRIQMFCFCGVYNKI